MLFRNINCEMSIGISLLYSHSVRDFFPFLSDAQLKRTQQSDIESSRLILDKTKLFKKVRQIKETDTSLVKTKAFIL